MARPVHDPDRTPTPERILQAATEVFASEGSTRATLADIGRRAGIRRSSLLYHFPSKDALYEAVVRRAFAELGGRLATAMASPVDFDDRLPLLAAAFETYLREHPSVAQLVVRELLGDGPGQRILTEEVAPLLSQVTDFVEREGIDRLRPDLPVRQAVLQVACTVLLHAASPVRDVLWGGPTHAETLVRFLFLRQEA